MSGGNNGQKVAQTKFALSFSLRVNKNPSLVFYLVLW